MSGFLLTAMMENPSSINVHESRSCQISSYVPVRDELVVAEIHGIEVEFCQFPLRVVLVLEPRWGKNPLVALIFTVVRWRQRELNSHRLHLFVIREEEESTWGVYEALSGFFTILRENFLGVDLVDVRHVNIMVVNSEEPLRGNSLRCSESIENLVS